MTKEGNKKKWNSLYKLAKNSFESETTMKKWRCTFRKESELKDYPDKNISTLSLSCLVVSLLFAALFAGCISVKESENNNDKVLSLPEGEPSFSLTINNFIDNTSRYCENMTLSGSVITSIARNCTLTAVDINESVERMSITTGSYIGINLSDFLSKASSSHYMKNITIHWSSSEGSGKGDCVELLDLVVGRGDLKIKSICYLLLASGNRWLENPTVYYKKPDNAGGNEICKAGIINSLSLAEWDLTVWRNGTSYVKSINYSVLTALPSFNFTASVIYHGDQTLMGNMTGISVLDILNWAGINITGATGIRVGSADTSEIVVIPFNDILNNTQSVTPISVVWMWDGKNISIEAGGPLRLVPPDDNMGDVGDFPSHYWRKWLVSIEVF
ncbi:MAG: hypothetical protein QW728_02865 [Thermoplasmata archaeon]